MIKQLRSLLVLALLAVVGQTNAQVVFTETFDQCASVGGNDGGWEKVNPSGEILTDNEGWTFENGSAAKQCAKFGTAQKMGSATTPSIALSGNGTLTFRAGAWKKDAQELILTAEGATLDVEGVTMSNAGAFTDYTVHITGASGNVKITFKGSAAAKGRFFLDDVVVTATGAATKKAAGLEFSAASATAVVGQPFTAPTLSNPNNLAVTYSSSNENVATVAADGTVTIKAAGTTTIKATSEETAEYYAGSASYTLTVATSVDNIAAFKALADKTTAVLKLKDAQVLYAYNNDMYVRDATGAIDFFKSGLNYTQNQMLNGSLVGTYESYFDTPELTNPTDVKLTATDGTAATPITLTKEQLTADHYCDLVKFAGVYNEADKTIGGVVVYDKFGTGVLDDFTDGASYAVIGILVPFKSEPEILVTGYEESAKEEAGLSYGDIVSATAELGKDFTEPTLTNPNNLPVTYKSSDENVATVDASGKVTLKANGMTTITASSAETAQYLAGSASYNLFVVSSYNNIADFKKNVGENNYGILNLKDAEVVYLNKYEGKTSTNTECYVRDASGAIVFFNTSFEYEANTVLNGTVLAKYTVYNGLPEITITDDENITTSTGNAAPIELAASDVNESYYGNLVSVTGKYAKGDKNQTIDDLVLYDKFKNGYLDNLTDGEAYTVVGIVVTYYNKTDNTVIAELAPIKEVVTGINDIKAETQSNGAVYNLAGQKVDGSYKGIVIRDGKKYLNK
ncbi:MAG: Ig-like domain-containing protein [Prevotella sp.]|nr:Ig-like domain-containing protein [Bacteroidales bacterium]MDY4705737.1 Ig-like domain-containing protein [Prevotella sp.]MDY4951425.1 Ig-like domain-containing protein [Prevotella sp.]MDY5321331.1 Ig-like domain-containing protein [Prevotella sp.]